MASTSAPKCETTPSYQWEQCEADQVYDVRILQQQSLAPKKKFVHRVQGKDYFSSSCPNCSGAHSLNQCPQEKVCSRCHMKRHTYISCRSKPCARCGKFLHVAKNCMTPYCEVHKEFGHHTEECSDVVKSEWASRKCMYCNRNHFPHKCMYVTECSICGETGHLMEWCATKMWCTVCDEKHFPAFCESAQRTICRKCKNVGHDVKLHSDKYWDWVNRKNGTPPSAEEESGCEQEGSEEEEGESLDSLNSLNLEPEDIGPHPLACEEELRENVRLNSFLESLRIQREKEMEEEWASRQKKKKQRELKEAKKRSKVGKPKTINRFALLGECEA